MIVIGRRVSPWILSRTASTGYRELLTLAVLALGIAYAAVALFDASLALGAFFAGMVLNAHELSHRAAQDTLPLRDAFAVLFFVSVGMLSDPEILLAHPLSVLAQIGEFASILEGMGMALGVMEKDTQNLVLAGAIVSIMLNPSCLEKFL